MFNFKRNLSPLIIAALCCTLFSSCASILHGRSQNINVSSIPDGATVSDGQNTFHTPCVLNLKRNKNHILTLSKPGYETETVQLTRVVSGAVAGNILAGGFIGWGVDATSGAQWRLVPENLSVKLHPLQSNEATAVKYPVKETIQAKLENLADLRQKDLITDVEYEAMRKITLSGASTQ